MTKLQTILVIISATAVQDALLDLSVDIATLNKWQMVPDASMETCLIGHVRPTVKNILRTFFELFHCFYWKKDSLQLRHSVDESGIISFFSKPMGVLNWQWYDKDVFTSYIYIHNKLNLGFNISFIGFTMGYSGTDCAYDKMLIETLNGLTVTDQDHYCGITPDLNHIALTSAIRITLETTGEYTTSVQLVYSPLNNNEFERHDKIPIKLPSREYTKFVQFTVTSKAEISERALIVVKPQYILSYAYLIKLGSDSVFSIYDGPFPDRNQILYNKLTTTEPFVVRIIGHSNGPIISVIYSRPFTANYNNFMFEILVRDKNLTEIFLKPNQHQQISSDHYCPAVNGITHCYLSLVTSRAVITAPYISNIVYTYKGPDIENCLYGKMLMSFDFDFDTPLLSICREDSDIPFWHIVSGSNKIVILMYSYNTANRLTFTAGITHCHGRIIHCQRDGSPTTSRLNYDCVYIYRFPIAGLNAIGKRCKVGTDFEGMVGLKAKRGRWNGKCTDQVRFLRERDSFAPNGYVANTSIEEWPYLVLVSYPLKKIKVDLDSNCRWSLTWLQMHAINYCGENEAQRVIHLQHADQALTFSRTCTTVRVPTKPGHYRQEPMYSFPRFYNIKYQQSLYWQSLKTMHEKCLSVQRNLCLSVHYISRDGRCPKDCVAGTMILISTFKLSEDYYSEKLYTSDVLNNATLILLQQRYLRNSYKFKIYADRLDTVYQDLSNGRILQYIYHNKHTDQRSHCNLCSIKHTMEVPTRKSSYILDTTPQNIHKEEPLNPRIRLLSRTKGMEAVYSYQTKYHKYNISSIVNASWLSANASCRRNHQSLLSMAQEGIDDILTDLYSTVNVWASRKAMPVLAFLGIQPDSEKVRWIIVFA